MSVTVVFAGPIKRAAGVLQTTSDAGCVRELVEELSVKFGEPFRAEVGKTKILVNGYGIQFGDFLATRLKGGDVVSFLQNWRIMDDLKKGGDDEK